MNHAMTRALTDSWTLGGVSIPNRVVLAPLAGIGNWFVRLQAKRYGAGLAVSEMVSSFAVHYQNERTCRELLRIHPDERAGGPVSVQLFGSDPDVMASAAEQVAAAGADLIDINMGCPVPKVCKTGAGAALLDDPERAVALVQAARRGSGLPVTVKLRSGLRPGDIRGVDVARRLVHDGGAAGLCLHPRHATQRHTGAPRLRARARARRGSAGAGARLRRAPHRREGAGGVRRDGRGGGAAGPRLTRQPVVVRGAARPLRRAAHPRGDPRRARLGDRASAASTSAPTGRVATCASSIPGTSSDWAAPARSRPPCSRPRRSTRSAS